MLELSARVTLMTSGANTGALSLISVMVTITVAILVWDGLLSLTRIAMVKTFSVIVSKSSLWKNKYKRLVVSQILTFLLFLNHAIKD